MSIFGSRADEDRYYTLFDISSGSVGVAIVLSKNTSIELVWNKRVEFGYQGGDDYNRYVRTMYATLLEVGMRLTSEGFKSVKETHPNFSVRRMEVVCVLGQPWFIGSVDTEVLSKEKPFQITESILQTLQESGIANVLRKQETLYWQEVMGSAVPLEVFKNSTLLEGYPVTQYEHRMVKELSIQFYIAMVSKSVLEHVEEVIKRILPNHEIFFSTSTHFFSSIHTTSSVHKNSRSVFIEISGEITSVSIRKNDSVMGVVTIPHGKNRILKVVAPNAVSAQEARSSLSMFFKKNTKIIYSELPTELQDALTAWHTEVTENIKMLSDGVTPPLLIEVVVDARWFPLYKSILEQPWEMPGVRQVQNNEVCNVSLHTLNFAEKEDSSVTDMRLFVLIQTLHACTLEKGMCYTK
jgi:hypothetical protein